MPYSSPAVFQDQMYFSKLRAFGSFKLNCVLGISPENPNKVPAAHHESRRFPGSSSRDEARAVRHGRGRHLHDVRLQESRPRRSHRRGHRRHAPDNRRVRRNRRPRVPRVLQRFAQGMVTNF